ncbi:Biotin carboxyl carrier protein of acetyl-CoA carboxylase 2, chloroplastic [Vitis vinifera]|uniref:Biotin carboxyl carrier protein of acetyl-CoA carboxylase n=1 Tax=Vitis vinifera TaxID=29760 RepID=A0A438H941_VITVI|nr:Biotin carboxyl carrier protein of acetyl-CoA carboxylase 2, chloroplastic [Vitis vinifera]
MASSFSSSFTGVAWAQQNQSKQLQNNTQISFPVLDFRLPKIVSFIFCVKGMCPNQKETALPKLHAQLNEVEAEKSSNSVPLSTKLIVPSEGKYESARKISSQKNTIPDASSISAFMSQVSDLVKLVDSRDIMELELKQLGSQVVAPASTAPSVPTPALPAPAQTSKSSHPPLKCPMAGTFYQSPGPGEPPFVKVGDKVQKGQVVCIVEAMKLMNEIEADQSGTIAEILAEDGKPVSIDTPLLVIAP